MSDQRPSTTSNAHLAEEYKKKHPGSPQYDQYTVSFTAQLEFHAYTGSRVGKHETLQQLDSTLYCNFLKHLIKHQPKLKDIANSIYREHERGLTVKLFGEFNKESPLKAKIQNEIQSFAEFLGSSSMDLRTPRRQLFLNNETELQKILAPEFNYKSAASHVNLSDPFNPIHVTLSYPLFCRVMNTQVHYKNSSIDTTVLKKTNRHEETYKKKYIAHMCVVATSAHEFLLAIISAYGTDPRKYPTSVLQMMEDRKFFKEMSAGEEISVPKNSGLVSSDFSHERLEKITTGTNSTSSCNIPLESGSTEQVIMSSNSYTANSTAKTGSGRNETSASQGSNDVRGTSSDGLELISKADFNKALEKCWISFHGKNSPKEISESCYEQFKSGFPEPNNRQGILKNCLNVLFWDCELKMWESTYDIKDLKDYFPKEFKKIEQELVKMIPQPVPQQGTSESAAGLERLMRNNNSLLQQALLGSPTVSDAEVNKIISNSIPLATEWGPTCCVLPFQVFQTLIYKMAERSPLSTSNLPGLDLDIVKLRYVEYLSVNLQNQNKKQFVLGVFHAYGPDVTTYPVRVLQLMKQKELLRPGTTLNSLIDSLTISTDPYQNIFEAELGIQIPKDLQLVPSPIPVHVEEKEMASVVENKPKDKSDEITVKPKVSKPITVNGVKEPLTSSMPVQVANNTFEAGKHATKSRVHTISSEEFFDSATALWKKYYGEQKVEMPGDWYGFFKSQFPVVNNTGGILDNCVATLLADQKQQKNATPLSIQRLETLGEFENITADFRFPPSKSKPGWHGLLVDSKTLLQQALIKPSDRKEKSVPLPNQWAPSFSVLPFHCFRAHIQWHLKTTEKGDLKGLDEEILKLRYVEYLFVRMRKIPQLLVGTLTAYGPNVLNYPIRVLQILHKRMVLKPEMKLSQVIGSLDFPKEDYINIFKIMAKPRVPTDTQQCSPSPSPTLPSLLRLTPQLKTSSKAEEPSTTLPPSSSTSAGSTNSRGTGGNNDTMQVTILPETFFECVGPSWKQFYGEKNNKTVPGNWFSRFRSQFPEPNNKNGILLNCVSILLRDLNNIGDTKTVVIPRLADAFPKTFKAIENNLKEAVPKYPEVILHSGNGHHLLMCNNKSLLQAALVAPIKLDPSNTNTPVKNAASVFQETDWCPSRCVFPFPAFQAHIEWQVKQKEGFDLKLDIEIMKLRFVEYVASFMLNTNQFLLAVFSAYGPHLLDYPIRVLQILRQRQLLKSGTVLYANIPVEALRVYCHLATIPKVTSNLTNGVAHVEANGIIPVPAQETSVIKPITREETNVITPITREDANVFKSVPREETTVFKPIPREETTVFKPIPREETTVFKPISREETTVLKPTPREATNVIKLAPSAVERKPEPSPSFVEPRPEQSPISFSDWRAKCEKALEEIREERAIPLDIPDIYFQELFNSYNQLAGSKPSEDAFRLFVLGVWAGSQLTDFKQESKLTQNGLPPFPSESDASGRESMSASRQSSTVSSERVSTPLCSDRSTTSSVSPAESVVIERSLVSCFLAAGELRVDDAGHRLIQSFGITLAHSVEAVQNSFVRAKKLELETLDKIQNEFSGIRMREFVTELSWRVCWITNEEDIQLTANLIQKLVKQKLISKPYVIDSIRLGVIQKLPELLVKVLNVTTRLSSFLVYLFREEEDFCWFLTITNDLRQEYVPVWMDLFKKTTDILKRKTSESLVMELFSRTPGAQEIA